MTSIEDRLRAAAEAAGATVSPGSIPPLRLPESPPGERAGRRGWRRATGWLAPLGAAAAVAAVITGSLAAAHVIGSRPSAAQHLRLVPVPGPDGLPPYFIRRISAVTLPRATLAIYSSATDRAVADATVPGNVAALAAGSDGQTFFAAVWGPCAAYTRDNLPCRGISRTRPYASAFYRITLTAAGARATLLPIRPMAGVVLAISAAPDGRKLAISWISTPPSGRPAGAALAVASTVTGQQRDWSATPGSSVSLSLISWLADDRRMVFQWVSPGRHPLPVLHLLDTAVPGTNLLAGPALLPPKRAGLLAEQALSPDGRTVIATVPGIRGAAGIPGWSVISFPAATGRPVRVLFAARPDGHGKYWDCRPLWASHTGQRVLIRCGYHPAGGGSQHRVFLAGPGHALRRLPWLETPAGDFPPGSMPER